MLFRSREVQSYGSFPRDYGSFPGDCGPCGEIGRLVLKRGRSVTKVIRKRGVAEVFRGSTPDSPSHARTIASAPATYKYQGHLVE